MILSEKLEFAFVHIPKCAGTTVRGAIEHLDESYVRMTTGLMAHPDKAFTFSIDGGQTFLDFHHLTLRRIHKHFPAEFERLQRTRVFALVRDPKQRLLSAVMQRLKQFGGVAVADIPKETLQAALLKDLEELDQLFGHSPDLPFEFIHFQPQCDYIELNGNRLATDVYATESIADFETALISYLGEQRGSITGFSEQRANVSKSHRFASVETLVQSNGWLKEAARTFVPAPLKAGLRKIVYAERSQSRLEVLEDPLIEAFLKQHYARDTEIYETARPRPS